MQIDERDIEKFLVREVKKKHGKAFKFVSPGTLGVPDRLICLPGGHYLFCGTQETGRQAKTCAALLPPVSLSQAVHAVGG